MVFSMIPLALKMEEGAESRAPMAVVLIGGLVTSTLLTLVLVPVMYTYLDDLAACRPGAGRRAGLAALRRRRALPPIAGGAEPALADPDAAWRPTGRPRGLARRLVPSGGPSRRWAAGAARPDDLA